mgnify:CR=1 FL=1
MTEDDTAENIRQANGHDDVGALIFDNLRVVGQIVSEVVNNVESETGEEICDDEETERAVGKQLQIELLDDLTSERLFRRLKCGHLRADQLFCGGIRLNRLLFRWWLRMRSLAKTSESHSSLI